MYRVRLLHWNKEEARERSEQLADLGYQVEHKLLDLAGLRRLRAEPPDAVVIDLSRLPSQGRDVALGIRTYKATRHVPLVFVGGVPGKVARVRDLLPDAVYTTWSEVDAALAEAIAHPPPDPVVPESLMAGYAGTPLPKKLGVKAGSSVALIDAPAGFEEVLGELPEGARLQREPDRSGDVTLWFVRSQIDLQRGLQQMVPAAASGALWIVWPKVASGVVSDLSQTVVRAAGLAAGLVDYKVCSVDATWSGLCFTQRQGEPR
jgi:CheY-like chemotaxis protein